MHVMFFTFIVAATIVVTILLFLFWLIVTMLRGITRLFLGPGLRERPRVVSHQVAAGGRRCPRDSCRALNPPEARFCRRCGERFEDPHRVAVRRCAML